MYSHFAKAVYDKVGDFRKNDVRPFLVDAIISDLRQEIDEFPADAVGEVKEILNQNRRQLDIREAGVGGMSWSFGYHPAASSRLVPVPGSTPKVQPGRN
jgi:hypothetical protein